MKKRILCSLLVYAIGVHAQLATAAPDHQPIMPLEPAKLIADMPPAPVGWTMLSSNGASDFVNGWVTAYGNRSFKKNPPPLVPGQPVPAVPPPPVTMNVHLTDTGFKTDFTGTVTAPKTGSSANTTFLQVNDFPARMIKIDDKTTMLTFLVKDRFLVEMQTVNMEDDQVKKMAESFDFTKLMTAPDTGETHVSDPVVLSTVDELNPQNTHSSPLFWSVAPPPKK